MGRAAAGPASPARRAMPAAGRRRRSVPCASMSEVTVSGPTQVMRAGQSRTAVVSLTSASASSAAADHLAARARSRARPARRRRPRDPASAAATAPSGSGDDDDDRQRPAGPGDVGEPADAGLAERVGERPIGGRGQDHGGDGHGAECTRAEAPTALPSTSVGQSAVPSTEEPRRPVPDAATPDHRPDARPRRVRADLRNVAIVAHVDHGKTTLVDAMLRQTGAFRSNQAVVDRVMDSGDLEREKGITILAKQTTVDHAGVRLNIVDTPGHADFGGEVERSLLMVDSVLLLVDAAEGPLPQTRYVLQKAMARRLPVVVAINKIDRGDARPAEVLDDDLRAVHGPRRRRAPDRVPGRLHERQGGHGDARRWPSPATDLRPLLDLLVEVTPPPTYTPDHPLQLLVTNLSANDYVGRMAVGRIWNGTIRIGQRISVVREEADDTAGTDRTRPDGDPDRHRDQPADRARHRPRRHRGGRPGRHRQRRRAARGDDRRHADRSGRSAAAAAARRRRADAADDVRGQHLAAGRSRGQVRHQPPDQGPPREGGPRQRLDRGPARPNSSEAFEVRGRGELQLAVLIEQMRREGFELTASRPEVLLRDGRRRDPGAVRADHDRHPARLHRRGPDRDGRAQGPARADDDRRRRPRPDGVRAAGPRADRLPRPAADRHARHGAAPPDRRGLRAVGRRGDPPHERRARRPTGPGRRNAYGLFNLEQRSELFIGAGVEVYEGMIVGENTRSGDMDVNPTKEKKLTNIRTHSHDESLRLTPPRPITLETALEFIAADELVEVTPLNRSGCASGRSRSTTVVARPAAPTTSAVAEREAASGRLALRRAGQVELGVYDRPRCRSTSTTRRRPRSAARSSTRCCRS